MALIIFITACNFGNIYRYLLSGDVSKALKREIVDKDAKRVNISELTKFQWDKFFIFGAYSLVSEICSSLEIKDHECSSKIKYLPMSEGESLFVFLENHKIVHVEVHIDWNGIFDEAEEKSFTPQNAVFDLVIDKERRFHDGAYITVLRPVFKNLQSN